MQRAGWGLNPRMHSLCWVNAPAVVAMTMMAAASAEWSSLSDLEKLHREKGSRAELEEKCQSWATLTVKYVHTCQGTINTQNLHAIHLFVCMLVLIHLLTKPLFLLNLP